jgi:hypothetical protein
MATGIAQSVLRLAEGWTIGGSNSDRGEIFCAIPDWTRGETIPLYNGHCSFLEAKRPGGLLTAHSLLAPSLRMRKSYTIDRQTDRQTDRQIDR